MDSRRRASALIVGNYGTQADSYESNTANFYYGASQHSYAPMSNSQPPLPESARDTAFRTYSDNYAYYPVVDSVDYAFYNYSDIFYDPYSNYSTNESYYDDFAQSNVIYVPNPNDFRYPWKVSIKLVFCNRLQYVNLRF